MRKSFLDIQDVVELKQTVADLFHYINKSMEFCNKTREATHGRGSVRRADRKWGEYAELRTQQVDRLHALLAEFDYVPRQYNDIQRDS